MIEIKNFFDKFLKIERDDSTLRDAISKTIFDITGIKILKTQIDIKENSIYLKCKPIYKGEIFMNLEKIKTNLKTFGINKNIN